MPGFKDVLKKAKEAAEKGLAMVQQAAAIQRLLSDFDEVVGTLISNILSEHGYQPMGAYEKDDYYYVKLGVPSEEKVKHHIDRDILRHYSPKDREKIRNIIADQIIFRVHYKGKGSTTPIGVQMGTAVEDVDVEATLKYYVEREGGLFSRGLKRDEHEVVIGRFSLASSKFVDTEAVEIKEDELRNYLEVKLKNLGLI